ncbi:Uncharacterised protein [Legionella lansingensis]|uniref:Thioredoxin domain-containing protein n=1 Tax=Legionella lansingensis TaxID=45067 RepID=A0A0W0VX79_9GAMM|nr:hypothetical protein [Legionella lansingensis]KTD24294.1 hypothetical protein Llan_0433 [Legionella lansingensis]SNV51875.1 Uncharacterised protein [Legionella lansingensis]
MRLILKLIVSICLAASLSVGWGETPPPVWFSKGENNQVKLQVYLFLSSTCPHCHKADDYFRTLEATTPWIEVHRYIINTDRNALTTFNVFLSQQNTDDFSVPAIFFCNSRWVGFANAQTTGKELFRALHYCQQQVVRMDQLTPTTISVLRQWANANWYESNVANKPSVAVFLPMLAITDGLNPCSLFCILALFAFLWLTNTRSLQITIGLVFSLVVGLVHAVQQVHTAFFFHALSWLRIPMIIIGLALLAYTLNYFKKLGNKASCAVVILVALSALGLQTYMQTCMPNFALIFQQWLSTQALSPLQVVLSQVIYQIIYILPLLLLVFVLVFWRKSPRLMKRENVITKVARISLILTAILLIAYPNWLANFGVSLAALALAIIIAILIRKKYIAWDGI